MSDQQTKNTLPVVLLPLSVLLAAMACLNFGGSALEDYDSDDDSSKEDTASESIRIDFSGLGLDAIDSYASTFAVTFEADDNPPLSWTYRLDTLAQTSPAAVRHAVSMEGVDPAQDLGDVTLTLVGDTQYMTGQAVGTGCLTFPAAVELDTSVLSPDSFLAPATLSDFLKRAGAETVASQTGTLYTFEADSLGDFTNVSGELVLADQEEYVMRYDFAGDTQDDLFAGGRTGRMSWHFELTDLAPEETVVTPEGCEIDYPLMDDAADVARLPGLIAYTSPSSSDDIVAFYEEALPSDGWDVYSFPGTREGATVLTYARAGELLSISIQPSNGGSEVRLFLEDRP
jgi:hypothetical protein